MKIGAALELRLADNPFRRGYESQATVNLLRSSNKALLDAKRLGA